MKSAFQNYCLMCGVVLVLGLGYWLDGLGFNSWEGQGIFLCTPRSRTSLAPTKPPIKWLKSKGLPRQAEVAQGVPGRLRPWISWCFGTTRVVGCQPNAPAAFTPGKIPGTHFERLSRQVLRKKSPLTPPGIDPGTSRLVAQCLNHYVTPGPIKWVPGLIFSGVEATGTWSWPPTSNCCQG